MNSVILAMWDYSDREAQSTYNFILNICSNVFNVIFITECFLKIISMGLIMHKKSYLRDGWNILDFVVVVSAIMELIPSFKGVRSLRVLRGLRPLRSINAVESMKRLVKVLVNSLPSLANVAALLFFIILLFGIIGLHQFSETSFSRCRLTEKPVNATYWPEDPNNQNLC